MVVAGAQVNDPALNLSFDPLLCFGFSRHVSPFAEFL
jgi:hypothetical protein